MTGLQLATLIGLPSIISAVIVALVRWASINIKSVKLGVQALLRAQMINDYNKYSAKGYAPIYAKDGFESCWQQYHNLGANGVMDDLHAKFMALPNKSEDKK